MILDFKSFIGNPLLEIFGRFNYQIPDDKEQQLYDFYMLNMLRRSSIERHPDYNMIRSSPGGSNWSDRGKDNKVGQDVSSHEDKLDYMLEEIAQKLLPHLKQELLDAVGYSLAAEMRHVFSRNNFEGLYKIVDDTLGNSYAKQFKEYVKIYLTGSNAYVHQHYVKRADKSVPAKLKGNQDRNLAYHTVMKVFGDNYEDFAKIAQCLYFKANWSSAFGGPAWGRIAKSWLDLKNATKEQQIITQIDHIYDLQHNTGSVLNKVKSYAKDGDFNWIKKALDHKAKIRTPWELYANCSTSMKKVAAPAIKEKFGQSKEDWEDAKKPKILGNKDLHGDFYHVVDEPEKSEPEKASFKDYVSFYDGWNADDVKSLIDSTTWNPNQFKIGQLFKHDNIIYELISFIGQWAGNALYLYAKLRNTKYSKNDKAVPSNEDKIILLGDLTKDDWELIGEKKPRDLESFIKSPVKNPQHIGLNMKVQTHLGEGPFTVFSFKLNNEAGEKELLVILKDQYGAFTSRFAQYLFPFEQAELDHAVQSNKVNDNPNGVTVGQLVVPLDSSNVMIFDSNGKQISPGKKYIVQKFYFKMISGGKYLMANVCIADKNGKGSGTGYEALVNHLKPDTIPSKNRDEKLLKRLGVEVGQQSPDGKYTSEIKGKTWQDVEAMVKSSIWNPYKLEINQFVKNKTGNMKYVIHNFVLTLSDYEPMIMAGVGTGIDDIDFYANIKNLIPVGSTKHKKIAPGATLKVKNHEKNIPPKKKDQI